MAKKKPVKPTPVTIPQSEEGATTTYSTRFDSKQRDLIEEAAKALDCSPARRNSWHPGTDLRSSMPNE